MLYDQIDRNKRRTIMLFALFAALIFGLSWAVDLLFIGAGLVAVAVVAGLIAGGSVTFAWTAADRVVLSAMGVRDPNPAHPRERLLPDMVGGLALAARMPAPRVYVKDDPAPNAFATGRTPDKGVVVFTTGLIEKMDRPEVEAVAAHELSHIANRDSMVGVVAAVLVGAVLIISRLALRLLFFGGGRSRGRSSGSGGGGGGGPLLLVGLAVMVVAPLFAMLLRLAISRRRESLADANAVRLTRNPDAMIGALQVLAGDHSTVDFRHGFAAHLWIEEPEEARQGWFEKLLNTHPPIPERIADLRGIAGDSRYR
ncbi:zinc metalloprotease HtpX [soil metagenome]